MGENLCFGLDFRRGKWSGRWNRASGVESLTVNAKASATGDNDSAIATASFTIIPLAITGIGGGPLQPPSSGIFEFEIHSSRAQETVQTSDDLVSWADAGTVSIVNSTGFFVDGSAGAKTKHFYRLKP